MHLVPLALGIVAILMGVAMVAFGIPINEFGTGNTLIAAGTTAIIGGFILLGLWAAVLQLQRLLGGVEPRSTRAAAERVAAAVRVSERDRRQGQAENTGLTPFRESRLAPEEAPDREPQAPGSEQHTRWPAEGEAERRIHERTSDEERLARREEEGSWELFAPSRPSGSGRERSFDTIWPSERPGREGREATHPVDQAGADQRGPERGSASAAGSGPATILKSGVINGMAYTLYTDGSIEAELPQGTLRFGSLDELRDYLARST